MLWLNGVAVTGPAAFDLSDRGLLLGDGVFDTALVVRGAVVWREAHEARLCDACSAIGLDVFAGESGARLSDRIAAAMDLASEGMALGAIRITVTRGPGPRGVVPPAEVAPTVIASRTPMNAPAVFQPLSLWASDVRRNETSVTSRIKSLGYLDNVLETQKARAAGCDETLLLNSRGDVACCGVGNIFVLRGARLLTPPTDAGVLAGVARAAVLRLASEAGLVAREEPLSLADVTAADAVFVTNSLRLISPVTRVGAVTLGCDDAVFARLRGLLAREARLEE